jgi:hypothetical protein
VPERPSLCCVLRLAASGESTVSSPHSSSAPLLPQVAAHRTTLSPERPHWTSDLGSLFTQKGRISAWSSFVTEVIGPPRKIRGPHPWSMANMLCEPGRTWGAMFTLMWQSISFSGEGSCCCAGAPGQRDGNWVVARAPLPFQKSAAEAPARDRVPRRTHEAAKASVGVQRSIGARGWYLFS